MNLLKMCGPQIRLCLFMFRPIASKLLNSWTTTPKTRWCRVNASALYAKGPEFNFYVWFFVLLCFDFFVQKHIICHKILQFILQC